MTSQAIESSVLSTPVLEYDKLKNLVEKMKSELCENWLQQRVEGWGPTKSQPNSAPSWTASITTKIGPTFHYITCQGDLKGDLCGGCWCRRDRQIMSHGLHCVYGGWVLFDGDIIIDVYSGLDGAANSPLAGRNLPKLRRLWAEHHLSRTNIDLQKIDRYNSTAILDQVMIDQVHQMIDKVLAQRIEKKDSSVHIKLDEEKVLGSGTGGWSGIKNGAVLKRDPGHRKVGNYMDRCDLEPGGMWQRGDAEVWITWNGWSFFATRDGRWRPGYHLEILLCQWLTVVDYGLTREVFRDRQSNWLRSTEWAMVNTTFDISRRIVEVFRGDVTEMIRREQQRMQALKPSEYAPDDASTSGKRYQSLRDRGGETIAYHTVGEGLEKPRGLVATWCMASLNDIVDYERDVLCGESNNIPRSLTSDQQVVDTAAWNLKALWWAMDNHDYDLSDAILGSATLYLVMWRYNGPKLARYDPVSVQHKRYGRPPELEEIAEIVAPRKEFEAAELATYGGLYKKVEEKVRKLYWGCTCRETTAEHDAWKLLAQAMDEKGNDDIEQRLHIDLVALNNAANAGDLKAECGIDHLLHECFVRTLDPDTGIIARLHYRSGNTELGNTITE
ncbi:hypothetical protein F5884DRAFT_814859 [Xylogone sp. PMI_703]|nr:hypothetical protein F5884DRAFT_814859 [Xylogone sp. PMI_703]